MAFLTGTGRHRVQIAHFLWVQIGSWRPLGVGLVVGKRLHRIRRRCGGLVLSQSPGSKPWGLLLQPDVWLRDIGRLCPEPGRMRCRRLHVYRTDPERPPRDLRTTKRQDSTGAAGMAGPSISRIKKKYFFSPPRKFRIDLFGPVMN